MKIEVLVKLDDGDASPVGQFLFTNQFLERSKIPEMLKDGSLASRMHKALEVILDIDRASIELCQSRD